MELVLDQYRRLEGLRELLELQSRPWVVKLLQLDNMVGWSVGHARLWEDDVALDVPVKKERHRVKDCQPQHCVPLLSSTSQWRTCDSCTFAHEDVVEMMLKEKRAAAHIIRSVVRAEKNGVLPPKTLADSFCELPLCDKQKFRKEP
eukprot:2704460-Amphidinium_carterae.1